MEGKPLTKMQRNLKNLKEQDLYSLSLFTLYKLIGANEFSSLSEMAYLLDKNSFLNLCEFFGGQTIRIPTIDEFEELICALLLYQVVNEEQEDYNKVVKDFGEQIKNPRAVRIKYNKLCEILKDYTFEPRS